MSPKIWGPPIWQFFHSVAENLLADNDNNNNENVLKIQQFIGLVQRIAFHLPCPDCSNHARLFFQKVNVNNISTKEDCKNMLFIFHNHVSFRKKQDAMKYQDFLADDKYKNVNLVNAYNKFVTAFSSKSTSLKLQTDTLQKKFVLNDLKSWLLSNLQKNK